MEASTIGHLLDLPVLWGRDTWTAVSFPRRQFRAILELQHLCKAWGGVQQWLRIRDTSLPVGDFRFAEVSAMDAKQPPREVSPLLGATHDGCLAAALQQLLISWGPTGLGGLDSQRQKLGGEKVSRIGGGGKNRPRNPGDATALGLFPVGQDHESTVSPRPRESLLGQLS